VLLTGDAMTIDTSVARQVGNQCLYLAGPGVMMNAFAISLFLWVYLPYNWPFLLCLTQGAILAATDPVAVVGLLKELGAPQTLSVQIGGESLLNDGTAIVLYTVAYDMLKGVEYQAYEVVIFLIETAGLACLMGLAIGYVFNAWIHHVGEKRDDHASMIQTALTLCCAYWSFILSEGVFKISGVLCTVCAGLVLADKMWPAIVSEDAMETVWHTFEYIGNTVIFFLAGALAGHVMVVDIHLEDYGHLIVIYVVMMLVRGVTIIISRPVLAYLSPDRKRMEWSDAAVMTWGGLRGAVGLALAIQVSIERAGCKVSEQDSHKVLFYTCGVATLTLVVNASTCPALVRFLDIGRTDASSKKLMLNVYEHLHSMAHLGTNRPAVVRLLDDILEEVHEKIDLNQGRQQKTNQSWPPHTGAKTETVSPTTIHFTTRRAKTTFDSAVARHHDRVEVDSGTMLITRLHQLRDLVCSLPDGKKNLLKSMHENLPCELDQDLLATASSDDLNLEMVRVVYETFLSCVRTQYWEQIHKRLNFADTKQVDLLLASVSYAMNHAWHTLRDFDYVTSTLRLQVAAWESDNDDDARVKSDANSDFMRPSWQQHVERWRQQEMDMSRHNSVFGKSVSNRTCTLAESLHTAENEISVGPVELGVAIKQHLISSHRLPSSTSFLEGLLNSTVVIIMTFVALALNGIFIYVEEQHRTEQNFFNAGWLVIELIFLFFFTSECLLKISALGKQFFFDLWNDFDLLVVILGITSLAIECSLRFKEASMSKEARLFRLAKVLRVMRVLRIFRLARFYMAIQAKLDGRNLSLQVAEYLRAVTVLTAFVQAHTASQEQLQYFFNEIGTQSMPEVARCIVESQISVYRAILVATCQLDQVNETVMNGMNVLRESNTAMDKMVNYVMETRRRGLIGPREANIILHPLKDRMQLFSVELRESELGLLRETVHYRESRVGKPSSHTPTNSSPKQGVSNQPRSSWVSDDSTDRLRQAARGDGMVQEMGLDPAEDMNSVGRGRHTGTTAESDSLELCPDTPSDDNAGKNLFLCSPATNKHVPPPLSALPCVVDSVASTPPQLPSTPDGAGPS